MKIFKKTEQKSALTELENQFEEFLQNFIRETKKAKVALRMANRVGFIVNEL